MRTIYRVFKFAAQNFWRNIWLELITVTILILTIISVNLILMINVIGEQSIRNIEKKIDFSVYFKPDAPEEVINDLRTYMASVEGVIGVDLINREEALKNFRAKHSNNTTILNALNQLDDNPFGVSLVVKADSPSVYSRVLGRLSQPNIAKWILDKNFDDRQSIIQKINSLREKVQFMGMAISGMFAFIALLIVINTIRVAIYIHREEIGIMKLVGASDWFVRGPFLVESLIWTTSSVLVAFFATLPMLKALDIKLGSFFGGTIAIYDYFVANFATILGFEFLGLLLFNLVGTYVALSRYLAVKSR